MSTHNVCFYGEREKISLLLSSNTHLICTPCRYDYISSSIRLLTYPRSLTITMLQYTTDDSVCIDFKFFSEKCILEVFWEFLTTKINQR